MFGGLGFPPLPDTPLPQEQPTAMKEAAKRAAAAAAAKAGKKVGEGREEKWQGKEGETFGYRTPGEVTPGYPWERPVAMADLWVFHPYVILINWFLLNWFYIFTLR